MVLCEVVTLEVTVGEAEIERRSGERVWVLARENERIVDADSETARESDDTPVRVARPVTVVESFAEFVSAASDFVEVRNRVTVSPSDLVGLAERVDSNEIVTVSVAHLRRCR